jgi:hypothetical protein
MGYSITTKNLEMQYALDFDFLFVNPPDFDYADKLP